MNEAVDRVLAERSRLDAGLSRSLLASLTGHMVLVAIAVAVPLLTPRAPVLDVMDGFAVALPRGGGGTPRAAEPPPAAAEPEPPPPEETAPEPAPPPPEPPRVLKPPREQPRPNALPEPESRVRSKPTPQPVAPRRASESGAGAATPGFEFGPSGPGIPGGTDSGGDWYLATVQQKIWRLWNSQLKAGFTQPIGVTFTIKADGTVTDVKVTQPSGVPLLDRAAQRAILNAQPFGPLPRTYGTDRKTIRAIFRPTDA